MSYLYQLITDHFNQDELKDVALKLGINFAGLLGETIYGKARELIQSIQLQGQTVELLGILFQERPNVQWLTAADIEEYNGGKVIERFINFLGHNRTNQRKMLMAIQLLLPRQEPKPGDVTGWRRIWLAGEFMCVLGVKAAEKDDVGRKLLLELRTQLAALLVKGELTSRARAIAGAVLDRMGDPRPDVRCEVPYMVEIPGGPFLMGSDKSFDDLAHEDEEPQHIIDLPAFAIGKYPVTVAQYKKFVQAGGYHERSFWTSEGLGPGRFWPRLSPNPEWNHVSNQPAVNVSWYETVAYCNWLSAATGRQFRLPDEAMWEKAARGTDGRIYPWGNEWDPNHLNAKETGIGRPTAVGMFPSGRSPFDIYDACGNVLEWCSGASPSNAPYPFKRQPYEKDLAGSAAHSCRGGTFNSIRRFFRAAYRYRDDLNPYLRFRNLGFRVAEELS